MAALAEGLLDAFLQLCAIPSPAGNERQVADAVAGALRTAGCAVEEDGAADEVGGNTGNLIARIPATATGTRLMFCAHMDTVPPTGPIEPEVGEDGIVRNGAGGILGADNKSAVAVMLRLAREAARGDLEHAGLDIVFTVCEETGLNGAAALDPASIESRVGFVFDHADDIGRIVERAPTQRWVDVRFHGRPAHAGIEPELGRSAVVAASRAIASMPHGRLDEQTTTNVGRIEGGGAINIVPEHCHFSCEVRSMDVDQVGAVVGEIVDCCSHAATDADIDVSVDVREAYRGYVVASRDPALAIARQALAECGYEPELVPCGGGSDANVFRLAGIACLNVCNGMRAIHTSDEHIAASDLDAMLDVSRAMVRAALVG